MTVLSTVVVSGVLLAATASLASSDYYIRFDGVDGESGSGARGEAIELQSWSFDATQAGVPPDAADSKVAVPAAGEIRTVMFAVPEPGDASTAPLARLCASGKHVKGAVLSGPDGRYRMNDVVVSSCAVKGSERRYELKGHVTLMK